MKDTIVCKDSRHLGKSLEILDSIDLRCYQPKFAITDGARGPVISWNGTFDREEPPFSKYMLYYSKVMNIGKFEDSQQRQSVALEMVEVAPECLYF